MVRALVGVVLVGAILTVGWFLAGPLLTIPRISSDISSDGSVVRNGVAAVVVCGKKVGTAGRGLRGFKGLGAAMDCVPEPRAGSGWPERRGECTVWYHRPPDWHQRYARHERAH